MDRITFTQCINAKQNKDIAKLIGKIDTEILDRNDSVERLYYALPLVEKTILEIFKLVPEADIEQYQQGIMRTPIEIINNNNKNKIISDQIVKIIEKYFKSDGIRNKLFHVQESNIVIEGYFNDITFLIMELLQILKERIELYNQFEIKKIEKLI